MTVFKRDMESTYQLKMKASRAVYSDIKERFGFFPFTMRAMDEKKAKFGIRECITHQLVQGYPVLQEKEGVSSCATTKSLHEHIHRHTNTLQYFYVIIDCSQFQAKL
jgi:hypothetical protein